MNFLDVVWQTVPYFYGSKCKAVLRAGNFFRYMVVMTTTASKVRMRGRNRGKVRHQVSRCKIMSYLKNVHQFKESNPIWNRKPRKRKKLPVPYMSPTIKAINKTKKKNAT